MKYVSDFSFKPSLVAESDSQQQDDGGEAPLENKKNLPTRSGRRLTTEGLARPISKKQHFVLTHI